MNVPSTKSLESATKQGRSSGGVHRAMELSSCAHLPA
jgi:hypothetical protein